MVSTTGKLTYYDGVHLWVRLHEYEALQHECDEMLEWIREATKVLFEINEQDTQLIELQRKAYKWLKEAKDDLE